MHKVLIIEGKLPNLNDYTKACRAQGASKGGSNFLAGSAMKKKCENRIRKCIQEQFKGAKFNNPVILEFRWYEENKMRDMDNVCFAKKFILDALVKEKTIITDGWRGVVGFTDHFYVDKVFPRIEVYITEVSEK